MKFTGKNKKQHEAEFSAHTARLASIMEENGHSLTGDVLLVLNACKEFEPFFSGQQYPTLSRVQSKLDRIIDTLKVIQSDKLVSKPAAASAGLMAAEIQSVYLREIDIEECLGGSDPRPDDLPHAGANVRLARPSLPLTMPALRAPGTRPSRKAARGSRKARPLARGSRPC